MKKNFISGNGSFVTIFLLVVLSTLMVDAAATTIPTISARRDLRRHQLSFQQRNQQLHPSTSSLLSPIQRKTQEATSCAAESSYLRESFPPENVLQYLISDGEGKDYSVFIDCSDTVCDYTNLLQHVQPACESMNGKLYGVSNIQSCPGGAIVDLKNYPVCVESSCDEAYVISILTATEGEICVVDVPEYMLLPPIITNEACAADMLTDNMGIGTLEYALAASATDRDLYCNATYCDFAPLLTPALIDHCEEQEGGYLYSLTDQVTDTTLRGNENDTAVNEEEGIIMLEANKPICIATSCGDAFVYLEAIFEPTEMYFRNGTFTTVDNDVVVASDRVYAVTEFSAISDIVVTGNIEESDLNDEEGAMGNSSQGSNIFAHNNGQGGSGNDTSASSSSLLEDSSVGGNKTFLNSGELRVALSQYFTNQSALVVATYGIIDDWDVSLVNEMKGAQPVSVSF